jgi:hypothetical protein
MNKCFIQAIAVPQNNFNLHTELKMPYSTEKEYTKCAKKLGNILITKNIHSRASSHQSCPKECAMTHHLGDDQIKQHHCCQYHLWNDLRHQEKSTTNTSRRTIITGTTKL